MVVVQCPFSIDTSNLVPYHERILENFNQYDPSAICLIDGETEKKYSFGEVKQNAINVAHNLIDLGFRKGDIMAVLMENRPEWIMVMLGVSSIGGIVTGINPAYTPIEVKKQLEDSCPKYLFTTTELLKKVDAIKYGNRFDRVFIQDEKNIPMRNNISSLSCILYRREPKLMTFPNVPINVHEDIFMLPYSSGTTGLPKGVMLTHANLNFALISGGYESMFSVTSLHERVVIILPYFHMAGFMTQSWAVMNRCLSIVLPKFDTYTYCQLVQKYRATSCTVVPTILVFLAKSPLVDQFDLSSIRGIGFGAAPAGAVIVNAIRKRFPHVKKLKQLYGMTESGGLSTTTPHVPIEQFNSSSVGPPLPGYLMKVISTKDGHELGPMEEGEICMKGLGVMKGYLNKPEATRETIDQDKWLHSGDVGYFDHRGYFYVVDRVKELVKYKAFQVAPAELEDLILHCDSIEEGAVTGIPDEINPDVGELPTAFVVLKNTSTKSKSQVTEEINKIVSENCTDYKKLRGGIIFMESLPKGGTGKVLRRKLRDLMKQQRNTKSKM